MQTTSVTPLDAPSESRSTSLPVRVLHHFQTAPGITQLEWLLAASLLAVAVYLGWKKRIKIAHLFDTITARSLDMRHVLALIAVLTVFWYAFLACHPISSNYAIGDYKFFQSATFLQSFGVLDFGDYKRFSPLAWGPIGYLDTHVLVPLLGISNEPIASLAHARRLVWIHPALSALTCFAVARVVQKLVGDVRLVVFAVLLIGLTDSLAFQFRFVGLFGAYGLQIATVLTLCFLIQLEKTNSRSYAICIALCVAASLGFWEEGLDVATATGIALLISIYFKWTGLPRLRTLPETLALGLVIAVTMIYLAIRVRSGGHEVLSANKEASYILLYKNPLPMIDDVLMNISAMTLQAFRQFLPLPPQSLSVMFDINMNKLNVYNLGYAQYPNMFYRMMELWYSGVAFASAVALVIYSVTLARRRTGTERHMFMVALCMFLFGFATHVPVMHRDYFYLPGYALGYKIDVSYIGFILLAVLIAREFFCSRMFASLSKRQRAGFYCATIVYYCAAAFARIELGELPHNFPW